MSTEPTKPSRPPTPPPADSSSPDDQQAAAPAAPPTVQAPVIKAADLSSASATQIVPQWQAPPPPPPPPAAPGAGAAAKSGKPPAQPEQPPAATPTVRVQAVPAAQEKPAEKPAAARPDNLERPTAWDPPQVTRWDRPADPTRVDRDPSPPGQPGQPQQSEWAQSWNQPPPQWPSAQAQQPGQAYAQPAPAPPPQPQANPQWEQNSAWTQIQPWVEPQDAAPPPAAWNQPAVNQQAPGQPGPGGRPPRKRRVRRSFMVLFTLIVLLILLVIGDRVALAVTENQMASQFQKQGFPVKPSVSISGFPFLTQLVAKDFNNVDISANDVPVPLPTGGTMSITSVKAKIKGLHISSFSSSADATVDRLDATAFVSFGALTAAGGIAGDTALKVTPDGPDKLKISAGIGGIFTDTEEAQITAKGQTVNIKVLPSNSILGSVLSSFGSYSFNLPKGVPPTLKITNVALNDTGLTISASATNATFSQ